MNYRMIEKEEEKAISSIAYCILRRGTQKNIPQRQKKITQNSHITSKKPPQFY